jgi:hypothetical protein
MSAIEDHDLRTTYAECRVVRLEPRRKESGLVGQDLVLLGLWGVVGVADGARHRRREQPLSRGRM